LAKQLGLSKREYLTRVKGGGGVKLGGKKRNPVGKQNSNKQGGGKGKGETQRGPYANGRNRVKPRQVKNAFEERRKQWVQAKRAEERWKKLRIWCHRLNSNSTSMWKGGIGGGRGGNLNLDPGGRNGMEIKISKGDKGAEGGRLARHGEKEQMRKRKSWLAAKTA